MYCRRRCWLSVLRTGVRGHAGRSRGRGARLWCHFGGHSHSQWTQQSQWLSCLGGESEFDSSLWRVERGHALWFEPKSGCDLYMKESQAKLSSSMQRHARVGRVRWEEGGGAVEIGVGGSGEVEIEGSCRRWGSRDIGDKGSDAGS